MSAALRTVDPALYLTLQQRLYEEARLLDAERWRDWLAMLTDDVHYVMPMPMRRYREDRAAQRLPWPAYIFNDTKPVLEMRIRRLESGFVWSEDPRNAVAHIVSNVEVHPADGGELAVHSLVEVHRSRLDADERRLVAARADRWREEDGCWRLARREVTLQHPVVLDSNLNLFF